MYFNLTENTMFNWLCCRDLSSDESFQLHEVESIKNKDDSYKERLNTLIQGLGISSGQLIAIEAFIKILTVDSISEKDIVSAERLSELLKSITSFDCGIIQLNQIALACMERNFKIAFRSKDDDFYGRVYTNEIGDDKILISLKKTPPDELVISVVTQSEDTTEGVKRLSINVVDIGKEINNIGSGKTIDWYIVGHELSHAMSSLSSAATSVDNNNIGYIFEQIGSSQVMTQSIFWKLFSNAEEARNLLGLGVYETKEIIGEYHYINEIIKGSVRIPYDNREVLNLVDINTLLSFSELSFLNIRPLINDVLNNDELRSKYFKQPTEINNFIPDLMRTKLKDNCSLCDFLRENLENKYYNQDIVNIVNELSRTTLTYHNRRNSPNEFSIFENV